MYPLLAVYIFLGHSQCKCARNYLLWSIPEIQLVWQLLSGLREVADSKFCSEAGYLYVTYPLC